MFCKKVLYNTILECLVLPAQDPRPHISFAWIAGDHEQALVEALKQLPSDLSDRLQLELPVQRIVCRLGTLEREVWNASRKAAVTVATARNKQ